MVMSAIPSPEAVRFSDWNYEGLPERIPHNPQVEEEMPVRLHAVSASQAAHYEYVEGRRFTGSFHGIETGYMANVADGINWFVSGRKFSRLGDSELLFYDQSFDETASAPLKASYRIQLDEADRSVIYSESRKNPDIL